MRGLEASTRKAKLMHISTSLSLPLLMMTLVCMLYPTLSTAHLPCEFTLLGSWLTLHEPPSSNPWPRPSAVSTYRQLSPPSAAGLTVSSPSLSLSPSLPLSVSHTHTHTPQTCNDQGTFAITFDDGVQPTEGAFAKLLSDNGAKGTFFVNGYNW